MEVVGTYQQRFNEALDIDLPCTDIFRSSGLIKHIAKHHPDCVKYYNKMVRIIAEPDLVGTDQTKPYSIELIKKLDEYILVAVTLDAREGYLYVSSMYDQTTDKINRRIQSGRYVRL